MVSYDFNPIPDTNPQPLEHWSLYIDAGEERYDRVVRADLLGAMLEITRMIRLLKEQNEHPTVIIIAKSQPPKKK